MIKKLLSISFALFLATNAIAYSVVDTTKTTEEETADANRSLPIDKTSIIETKTYATGTDDIDSNNWNAKDWEKHLSGGKGDITNARVLFEQSELNSKAFGENPNEINSDTLKDEDTVKIWDTNLQDGLIANTTSSSSGNSIAVNTTVQCYISRDMPIRYKCDYNGLVVSKAMDSTGLEAKSQCEDNCIEEQPCLGVIANPVVNKITMSSLSLSGDSLEAMTGEKDISSDVMLDKIEYKISVTKKDGSTLEDSEIVATLSLSVFDFSNERSIIDKYSYKLGDSIATFKINSPTDKIKFVLERENVDSIVTVSEISATYKINSKFICKNLQDISGILPTEFAYKCPSGNIITFGSSSIEICADYGILGDNRDGTFSDQESCNAICETSHTCSLDVKITDTASLEDFREGCIQGQSACTENVDICSELRLGGSKVLTENVFNARQEITNTIVNTAQVQGTTRPRVLLSEDVDFQTRSAEEWKDEAYKYMIANNKFKTTSVSLNENTNESSVYSFGIDAIGSNGLPVRSLYWILKPKAFDVDSDEFYYYSILEVVAEKYEINESGTKVKVKDKIMYAKTDETNDYFKPFARVDQYSTNVLVDEVYQETLNPIAEWKYKTFSGGLWSSISGAGYAEFFKKEKIEIDSPFKRINVIKNIKELIYTLNGLARKKVTIGAYETYIYTGDFNGTGETLGKYTEYAFYSRNKLTYDEVMQMIENHNVLPIYDSLSQNAYSKNVRNDNNEIVSNINTYLYGKDDSKSAYVRIFPKDIELNKKGFLFIFAY